MNNEQNTSSKQFQDLFPGQSPQWYIEAEANFDAYLALVIQIYDRISADPAALAELRAALNIGPK